MLNSRNNAWHLVLLYVLITFFKNSHIILVRLVGTVLFLGSMNLKIASCELTLFKKPKNCINNLERIMINIKYLQISKEIQPSYL